MFSYFEYNRVEDGYLSLETLIKAKQIMVNFLFWFIGKVKAYITGIWLRGTKLGNNLSLKIEVLIINYFYVTPKYLLAIK